MNNNKFTKILIAILIPLLYALLLRAFFGIKEWTEIFSVMTVSFLFLVPVGMGVLTTYLSEERKTKSIAYKIFMPWAAVLFFFAVTLAIAWEGWACWVMILPVFLVASSIGGLIGGWLQLRKNKNKLSISLVVLLPFLLAPLESFIENIPGTYKAYTFIDIAAPAEKIWDQVTRVEKIPEEEDTGYLTKFLGFPRPVEAVLDFKGVGAYRKAIFTNGLVFHETVKEYTENKKMVFQIKTYPHEIPSTTMDEHVVIGGKFFDVLEGTYELEKLDNGLHRLHLYSFFEMKTTFNFYAGWWGQMIMKDIQNNILRVEKRRAENSI